MAFTLAHLTALEEAISTGTKKIKYGDKETEFQSLDDMLKLRDVMKNELFPPPSFSKRVRVGVPRSTQR